MSLALSRSSSHTRRKGGVNSQPAEAAASAQLRYVSDERPGIRRLRRGGGFRYLDSEGRPVRDLATLRRIKSSAIPPAWTDVWICPLAHGHIQAVGRDARGRKQYRYHARWRETRDQNKYARLIEFGRALPRIRRRVEEDLGRPHLPREKVLAAVVRLLETTLIRVGNEEYARENHSYGLTTLRSKHVTVEGATLRFEFRGKGGKRHAVDLADRRLARVVRHCQELPGHELFQYVDDEGQPQVVDSADVNEYLRQVGGGEFTAKDFRTWGGTVLAALALASQSASGEPRRVKRELAEGVAEVARHLGNTVAICRKCYIHPAVIVAHAENALPTVLERSSPEMSSNLTRVEAAVLRLLEARS